MSHSRRATARRNLRAVTRTCTTSALVLAMGATLGTSALTPARADRLDDEQQRLQQAMALSRATLAGDRESAASASAALASSQGQLAERQQALAGAQAAFAQARATDASMADRLAASRAALALATRKVADNQVALDAELKLASATLSNLQQANPLEKVAVFTNNVDPGDVNQRTQWAQQSASMTQDQALRLAELQRQLADAKAAQASATARVADQRAQAAAHLQETRSLRASAEAQAAAVAAQVRLNSARAADARARVVAQQQQAAALAQQSAVVHQKIAARDEAARQARLKAAREAAARAAARAAAARAAAARAAAQRAAAQAAAARADAEARAAARAQAARAQARAEEAARAARAARASQHTPAPAPVSAPVRRVTPVRQVTPVRRAISQVRTYANYGISPNTGGYSATVSGSEVDPWGFYSYECVSYAAYMVRTATPWGSFRNDYRGVHFGNAVEWAAAAQGIGVPVNTTPAVGAVAWRSTGRAGHVAIVTAVHGDGTIDIAEYNMLSYHEFDVRSHVYWQQGGSLGFDGFIHFESTQP